MPYRYEAPGDLAPRVEIKQVIHSRVHEPQHDLGWLPGSPGNGQDVSQQGAVVPAKMAIRTRLVLPRVPPVRSSTDDGHGRMRHRRFHRCRLDQVSAKIAF